MSDPFTPPTLGGSSEPWKWSLKPDLAPTTYKLDRGNGVKSIPNTGGNKESDTFARPTSMCFPTKENVLAGKKNGHETGKIFLGRVDQKMIGIADPRHVVTLAGSRGGKSACSLIPNLKMWAGSALVLDPKGELARETAQHRKDAGQKVIVLDPWDASGLGSTDGFNPLSGLIDASADRLIDDSNLIADSLIVTPEKAGENAHFYDSAKALVQVLILMIVTDDGETTLSRLSSLLSEVAASKGENMITFDSEAVPEEVEDLIEAQGYLTQGMGERERGSVISTARAQLAFLESPSLAKSLDASAFALGELKRENATVYMCLPASRMGTHSRWLRLIVSLSIAALEEEKSTPAHPVLFVLEEFASLGYMKPLETAVAYMAGFGVKLWAVLQDLTQLKRHYKESWETFLGNAGVVQAFSVSDQTTLEYLSKRLGKTTLVITNKQDTSSQQAMQGDTGERREFKEASLMAAEEIAQFFAHKTDEWGQNRGGLSLVLWSGNPSMIVDRVYHGELVQ